VHHWNDKTGYPEKIISPTAKDYAFLYFPTCISRMTGKPADVSRSSLFEVITEIAKKANINLKIPDKVNN